MDLELTSARLDGLTGKTQTLPAKPKPYRRNPKPHLRFNIQVGLLSACGEGPGDVTERIARRHQTSYPPVA